MNIRKLFEMQTELDAHILENHPVQPGESRLQKKLLALSVELGECANEWRGFKFWSEDQQLRTQKKVYEEGHGLRYTVTNPLLEEYVDCLHFILSIAKDLGVEYLGEPNPIIANAGDVTAQFLRVINFATEMQFELDEHEKLMVSFMYMASYFWGLGELLGFTWQQVEDAYKAKNSKNHMRQNEGY